MRDSRLSDAVRHFSSVHISGTRPNVCILSSPRSGSTWLLELILTQRGFKPCNEPFNIRKTAVSQRLGLTQWEDLYSDARVPAMESYLQTFLQNSYSAAFKNLRPGERYYRSLTSRIAFKILHACEHRVGWLQDTLNARVVFLLRHPIPVALSREELPRLTAFLDSDFRRFLTREQQQLADEVLGNNKPLELGVLDWCLQNCVPLQHFRDSLLLVTYEQLVLKPAPLLEALARYLELDSVDRMFERIDRPSASVSKSAPDTANRLQAAERDGSDREWLVEKWRSRVDEDEERKLMKIVEGFGLDIYQSGSSRPAEPYWL